MQEFSCNGALDIFSQIKIRKLEMSPRRLQNRTRLRDSLIHAVLRSPNDGRLPILVLLYLG